jgi:hypothetical protein
MLPIRATKENKGSENFPFIYIHPWLIIRRERMKRVIFSLMAVILAAAVIVAGCGGGTAETAEEPDYAVPIVEAALKSLSGGDYETYLSLFIEEGQQALTEEAFTQGHQVITGKIGEYRSKTYVREAMESGYKVLYYEAEFSGETEKVTVKAVFQEEEGEMKLAGFWLDSPNLRK